MIYGICRSPLMLSDKDGKMYCVNTNKWDIIDPITNEVLMEGVLDNEVYNTTQPDKSRKPS